MLKLLTTLVLAMTTLTLFGSFMDHTGPKEDRIARNNLDRWALQVAKNYGMELVTTGTGAIIDQNDVTWCLSFMNRCPMRVDQVRQMVTEIAQGLNDYVNADRAFLGYLNRNDSFRRTPDVSRVGSNTIGFKITFWDANVDRMQQPYVAQAIYTGNKITYLFADPKTQRLVNPQEEAFILH